MKCLGRQMMSLELETISDRVNVYFITALLIRHSVHEDAFGFPRNFSLADGPEINENIKYPNYSSTIR